MKDSKFIDERIRFSEDPFSTDYKQYILSPVFKQHKGRKALKKLSLSKKRFDYYVDSLSRNK
jgi:hypothetical protein